MDQRWEGDERGRGVGDAAQFGDGPSNLITAMRNAGWVAEDPAAHLLPHIEAAIGAGAPFAIDSTETELDGTYVVRLRANIGDNGRPRAALRAAIFALVGSFAEPTTYMEERDGEFLVVTGLLEGQTRFASHGHVVRLIVE